MPRSCSSLLLLLVLLPGARSSAQTLDCSWSPGEFPSHVHVHASVAVANLTDDNGDGATDEQDIPDLVFPTTDSATGTAADAVLRIVDGRCNPDGTMNTIWTLTAPPGETGFDRGATVAIGNLDPADQPSEAAPEIVAIFGSGRIGVYDSNGVLLWESTAAVAPLPGTQVSIADLHADGSPEIIVGGSLLDGQTGQLLWTGVAGSGTNTSSHGSVHSVADWNRSGDGSQEVIIGPTVLLADGIEFISGSSDGYNAIADIGGGDDLAELVEVWDGDIRVTDLVGLSLFDQAIPGGGSGGPPVIADFDGDGEPEFGTGGLSAYSVFDLECTALPLPPQCASTGVRWSRAIQEPGGQLASSAFDLDGDGAAEVLLLDEANLYILDGATGATVFSPAHPETVTWLQYPVVADIDADGLAEVVVPIATTAVSPDPPPGVHIYSDPTWSSARGTWNQYAYSVTNIDDAGQIPSPPLPHWLDPGLNSFRANAPAPPGPVFAERFSLITRGGVVMAGNTLGLSGDGTNGPGTQGSIHTFIADVSEQDTIPAGTAPWPPGTTGDWTRNESAAVLDLPAGATVRYAELVWGGSYAFGAEDVLAFLDDAVRVTPPGGAAVPVLPDPATAQTGPSGHSYYVRSANVTDLVRSGGAGSWTVGGVPATQDHLIGELNAAGWTLVVVYSDLGSPIRHLVVQVGGALVNEFLTAEIDFTGISTPDVGEAGRLWLTALEGDAEQEDTVELSSGAIFVGASGPNNPGTNFFASQINDGTGALDTRGSFGSANHSAGTGTNQSGARQGWDVTAVSIDHASGTLGASGTTVRASGPDQYLLLAAALEASTSASGDADGDGITDLVEDIRGSDPLLADTDVDGVPDGTDRCFAVPDTSQADSDMDSRGDACDIRGPLDTADLSTRAVGVEIEQSLAPELVGLAWTEDPIPATYSAAGDTRSIVIDGAEWEARIALVSRVPDPGSVSDFVISLSAASGEFDASFTYEVSGEVWTTSLASSTSGGITFVDVPSPLRMFCSPPPCDLTVPTRALDALTGQGNAIGGIDIPGLNAFPEPNDIFSPVGDIRISESEDHVDHDGDGIPTGDETAAGTDPLSADSDGDGLDDAEESAAGTDPLLADTDGDGLTDAEEVLDYPSDPLVADTDGDGVLDGADSCPTTPGTDPLDADADGIGDSCDNCPVTPNRNQSDRGGLSTPDPDGVGDRCQNADFNGDGQVDMLDVTLIRRALIGLEPGVDPSMPPAP